MAMFDTPTGSALPPGTMRLRTVRAGRGLAWVRQGLRTFMKQPMAFAALFAAFMFAVFVLALLPLVGSLLVLALLPLVTLGFMSATRIATEGGFPTARVFTEPLRGNRPRALAVLKLGLVYAAATFAVMWLSDWVDGGAFEALMQVMPAGEKAAPVDLATRLAAPGLATGMLLRFGLAGVLAVPFWHAPALVLWGGQGAAQALFSSTLACWRNRGAFAVYFFSWFAIVMSASLIGSLLLMLLGQPQMMMGTIVPLALIVGTMFYASLYFTFADCFVSDDGDALTAAPANHPTTEEPL